MARIKFLDVLEETKRKPSLNYEERSQPAEQAPRFEHSFQDAAPREPRPLRETRLPASFAPRKIEEKEDGNLKIVWMASLFIFFGGVLFLGGYWLGQALKREMPRDRIQQEAALAAIPAPALPTTLPAMEPLRSSEPAPIPRVIKPLAVPAAPKAVPKKDAPAKAATPAKDTSIGNGEFVIQVSAHTTIEAARANERLLIENGIQNVYISESYIGDAQKVFRVRVRNGFKSKAEAQKALPKILGIVGLPKDDGRIIPLN